MSIFEMQRERATLHRRCKDLLNKADGEHRDLTADEQRQWDADMQRMDQLKGLIDREPANLSQHQLDGLYLSRNGSEANPAELRDRFQVGMPVTLTREQRTADLVPAAEKPLSLGKYVRGILTGNWQDAPEERAMSVGTNSAGGYMVPTPLASNVIDRARNLAAVFQAGAQTVPMTAQTLKMARVSGDPTAYWLAENGALTASDPTFEQVTFDAKTLAVLVKASRQVIDDAPNAERVIENTIAQAIALELDRVCIYGSGASNQPTGLMSAAGVTTVSMGANGAQLTNHDKFLDAIYEVELDNHTPAAYLMAPRTAKTIRAFKDTTNQPLQAPAAVTALSPFVTNQISITRTQGTATNASDIVLGDFTQLMVGMRIELVLELLRERFVDNLQYGFLAYIRADVQFAHVSAFAPIVGIIP